MLTSGYVAFEIRALRCVSHRLHDLFLLNIPVGPALRAVHLFGVHPWRPWQVRILPTAQQPEPGLRAFLDRWALETVDHVAGVGKAVGAQVVGAGLAAFTAGAAHGDDLGVLVEAAFLQFRADLRKEIGVLRNLVGPALFVPGVAVHQQVRDVHMHRIGEADEHDLHRIAHVDKQQLRFVLLNAVIDGLSGNIKIVGTGGKS